MIPLCADLALFALVALFAGALGRRLLRWLGVWSDSLVERAALALGLGLGAAQVVPFALFALGLGRPAVFRGITALLGLALLPDAAAVLRWAGVDDLDLAATLGADVPFCLAGGRARVTGVGQHVESLPMVTQEFTLLTPPLHVSTPAVYKAWDSLGGPTADGPNDLEPAALRVEPRLGTYRDRLGELTGQTPILAGSGSTWFVRGSYDGDGLVQTRTDRP